MLVLCWSPGHQDTNQKQKRETFLPKIFFPGRYPGPTASTLPVLPGRCKESLLIPPGAVLEGKWTP
eukprot:892568-Amphidinium_carterae.1